MSYPVPHPNNPRSSIDRCLERGELLEARRQIDQLWRSESNAATAGFVLSRYERLKEIANLRPMRVAILRSFTVEPVIPILRAAAAVEGIDLTVRAGAFNAYAQEILMPDNDLYRSESEVAILAVQTRDVAPELWDGFADLPSGGYASVVERVSTSFRSWIAAFRSRTSAHLVVHTLEAPVRAANGIMDSQAVSSQHAAIHEINQALRAAAASVPGVYVLDYDGLVARHGRLEWLDDRKWWTVRLPLSAQALPRLAVEWLRFLVPLSGRICKVLAVDLDNTLWGGILGEDGADGIQIGTEYPGAMYRALQRVLLNLHRRGILLAITSKNDAHDATAVLQSHPGMLLRNEHFAAIRINWNDKAESLREIARELNVGIDSISFLDDNPGERQRVRMALPEVRVIELPQDAAGYAEAVCSSPVFERLSITAEDRLRTEYYAHRREQEKLAESAGSIEEYYDSLNQQVEISPLASHNLSRVAQLTQKTNQFNLTTRRYSPQQLQSIAETPGYQVYAIRVEDRFGDLGIVGVAVIRRSGDLCEIDTFLLSCRVIGRTIETAVLSFLIEENLAAGAAMLQGWYLPTKKNGPAREVYAKHGFECIATEGEGSLWSLDLRRHELCCPSWIRLLRPQECVPQ